VTEVVDPEPAAAMLADVARWAADLLAEDPRAAAALDDLDRPVAVEPEDCAATYRLELLRIAARDLLGIDDVPATGRALSAAAVAAVDAVLSAEGLAGGQVAVVGMGKLGGDELNFASDVDLLLVADDPAGAEPALRRALDSLRGCVRVDLDLRPEGRDGALVRTVESYASYWSRWRSRGSARPCCAPASSPATPTWGAGGRRPPTRRCGHGPSMPTTSGRCGR
jgi:glutamate-ammonia-ligase adenylyltransferase